MNQRFCAPAPKRFLRMLDRHAAIIGRDRLLLARRHAELNARADFRRQRKRQGLIDAVRNFQHDRADDGRRRRIARRDKRIIQLAAGIGDARRPVQGPLVDGRRAARRQLNQAAYIANLAQGQARRRDRLIVEQPALRRECAQQLAIPVDAGQHGVPNRRRARQPGGIDHGVAVIIAHPDADRDIARIADGPVVLDVVGGAGLDRGEYIVRAQWDCSNPFRRRAPGCPRACR